MTAVHMQLDYALQTAAFLTGICGKRIVNISCKDLLTDEQIWKPLILIRAVLFSCAFVWPFPVSLKPYLHSAASTSQDNYFHSA
jgi:hypothetical protein